MEVGELPRILPLGNHWCTGNLSPRLESMPHVLAVDRGREQVPSGAEVGGDGPLGGEDAFARGPAI
jgi:hypothetical protein